MIEHLAVLLDTFPGAPNQTRCFAHILNLVAKSVLRQFEGPKKDKVAQALAAVSDEIDGDNDEGFDSGTNEGGDECDDVDDELVDDDDDELPDELDELSEEEVLSVKESVKPIRLVLTKVSQFNKYKHHSTNQQWVLQLRGLSNAIKNSSTIVLPKWYEVLEGLSLNPCMMPRDVSTRWNSTYDMVEFATEYRAALDIMTADRDMNLRKFELSKKEWGMATELCEVLQVGFYLYFSSLLN
jgi:hypothetical protein